MSKLILVAVKDEKAGIYLPLNSVPTEVDAHRAFQAVIMKEGTTVHTYPQDFSLWKIGEFDPISGELFSQVRHLANAVDFLPKAVSNG